MLYKAKQMTRWNERDVASYFENTTFAVVKDLQNSEVYVRIFLLLYSVFNQPQFLQKSGFQAYEIDMYTRKFPSLFFTFIVNQ